MFKNYSWKKVFWIVITLIILLFSIRSTFNKEAYVTGQVAQPQETPKRILVNFSDELFEINNATDIKNICVFINRMKQISIGSVSAEYITIGQFEYEKEKKNFMLGSELLILGDKAYIGRFECESIWNIIEKYDSNLERLSGILEESNEVIIYAKDLDIDKRLQSEHIKALIGVIEDSELQNISWEGPLIPNYPDYYIELSQKSKEGINYSISLVNESLLAANFERTHIYHCNPELYNFVQSIMEIRTPGENDGITYLFNATGIEIREKDLAGDYSLYTSPIARLLNKASEVNQSKVLSDVKLRMYFIVNEKKYEVIVYENHFTFDNKTFYKKGIYSDLINILTAG